MAIWKVITSCGKVFTVSSEKASESLFGGLFVVALFYIFGFILWGLLAGLYFGLLVIGGVFSPALLIPRRPILGSILLILSLGLCWLIYFIFSLSPYNTNHALLIPLRFLANFVFLYFAAQLFIVLELHENRGLKRIVGGAKKCVTYLRNGCKQFLTDSRNEWRYWLG